MGTLEHQIARFADAVPTGAEREARKAFDELLALLNEGQVRAAERDKAGTWRVNAWVKMGILLGFRLGKLVDMSGSGPLRFFDKDTYPLKRLTPDDTVRVVPGGSSIRTGAYVAPGTIVTGATQIYDLPRDRVYRREGDAPLEIPARAVVVPGSRPVTSGRGKELGLSLYAPVIVKYRDEKTDASLVLEHV